EGLFACSGTLVNNQSGDGTPYFLTANHCFAADFVAHTATFYWHYGNDVCNSGTPAYGPTTYGATLLTTSPDYLYDSSLLLMDMAAPVENTYSGWTTSPVPIGTSLTSVHHPSASWRRIAFGTSIKNTFVDFPDDIAVSWSQGITEPGSSGGP